MFFSAKAQRQSDLAKELLEQIAASSVSGKLNFTTIEELALKCENSKLMKWIEARHAYVYSFMATLLQQARLDGVLASAEFLWLKPLDRRLWYVLNSIGRQTVVVEVAGPFAHWLAEKKLKRPLRTPVVSEAVHALEHSVQEILYIDESQRWH